MGRFERVGKIFTHTLSLTSGDWPPLSLTSAHWTTSPVSIIACTPSPTSCRAQLHTFSPPPSPLALLNTTFSQHSSILATSLFPCLPQTSTLPSPDLLRVLPPNRERSYTQSLRPAVTVFWSASYLHALLPLGPRDAPLVPSSTDLIET